MQSLFQYSDLWLIGGGGKTTFMFKLAKAYVEHGKSVICTTTTKIWQPTTELCSDFRVGDFNTVYDSFATWPATFTTVVKSVDKCKCHGFPPQEATGFKRLTQHLVVEADGAGGRPIKTHASHEPQIASDAACVAGVVGAWCLGTVINNDNVHRPELFAKVTGRPLGATIRPQDVAAAILNADGWINAIPPEAAFYVIITGEDPGIDAALQNHPQIQRVSGIIHFHEPAI